ncbi:MAG: CHAT domain-containing protein [Microcoleaceae cyanobacterium]
MRASPKNIFTIASHLSQSIRRIIPHILYALLSFLIVFGLHIQPQAIGFEFLSLKSSNFQSQTINLKSQAINSFSEITTAPSLIAETPKSNIDFEQRGQTLYQVGNFEEAARVWQDLANHESDPLRRAVSLGNLSLCWQQLGAWNKATQAIADSLELLSSLDQDHMEVSNVLAQALTIRGNLQFALGESAEALAAWQASETHYRTLNQPDDIAQSLVNQAQALQGLGLYPRAEQTLVEAEKLLRSRPDSLLKVTQFHHLGNVLRVLGKLGNVDDLDPFSCQILDTAHQLNQDSSNLSAGLALHQALDIAQRLKSVVTVQETQLSLATLVQGIYQREQELGNVETAQKLALTALTCYQQAASSTNVSSQIRARLNTLSFLLDLAATWDQHKSPELASQVQAKISSQMANWPELEAAISTLPPGRTAIYARLDLAQSLLKLSRSEPALMQDTERILTTAWEQANRLGDRRTQSYGLGYLGELFEQRQAWPRARLYTEEALLLAQSIQADEVTYQWQWQLGRILRHQEPANLSGAIAAYNQAVQTLQSLRRDLVAVSQDVQFDFRDRVEPVYREFVDLLLQPETPSQEHLKRARQVIEGLQLAELDNFFRDACLEAKPQLIDEIDPEAVVIYGIILDDRLEVIASLPDAQLVHYRTTLSKLELTKVLRQLRIQLQKPYAYQEIQQLSQQVYRWLIQPVESQFTGDETLVFVLDGELRNIPMAALYDGKNYLIEKHPIAIEPGLQLVDPKLMSRPLKILSAGLVDPPPAFQAQFSTLPNVPEELRKIQTIGVETKQLLNEAFSLPALTAQINSAPFQIVHLATHGQFSSQAEKTFILASDGPINIIQLDTLFRSREQNQTQAIDLLVLSACETAPGDNRAVLGLAGMAVRAGARSTIASLWSLNDASAVEFVGHFYEHLVKGASRAEALRQAQLAFLQDRDRYDAPIYWAAYVLVGNWR